MAEFEQHSLGWFRSRLGNFTGSQVGDLMQGGRKKGELFGQTAMSYIYSVAATRYMNNKIVEDDALFQDYLDVVNVSSRAMEWGTMQEVNARALYAKIKGARVKERGLAEHPSIPFFASSPDGYVEKDKDGLSGCVEIKCPSQSTYMRYRAEVSDNDTLKAANKNYYYQCQAHMMCCDADYTDFVAYCPFQAQPIHIVRITPCKEDCDAIEERINKANDFIETLK